MFTYSKREYGIDLLKIVAMIMVVMLHIMGSGGVIVACSGYPLSARYISVRLLQNFCLCAVNCFVLATGYIMSRHEFRYSRIIPLWSRVVLYSLCFAAFAEWSCPWVSVTWRDWVSAILPVASNHYWFVTMYVALFFTIPFLNRLLKSLDRSSCVRLIITGFSLLSLYPSLMGHDLFATHYGYSYLWFVYLYLVAGAIALHKDTVRVRLRVLAGGGVILPIISVVVQLLSDRITRALNISISGWSGYTSPCIFGMAVILLLMFSRINVTGGVTIKTLKCVAPSVFSVYVLHSNSIFRRIFCWNDRFSGLADMNILSMMVSIVGIAIFIFAACIAVDIFRRMLSQKIIDKVPCFKRGL